eukprot:Lankesteria_metandrocarpae@DN4144_c0_g2_i1.p1
MAAMASQQHGTAFTEYTTAQAAPVRPTSHVGMHAAAHVASSNTDFVKVSGRRKALLVGINYIGQQRALRGCIPDVVRMKKMVTSLFGFPDRPDSMVVLVDDATDPRLQPTRSNMMSAIDWLVHGAQSGDILFFHFSGHGSRTSDVSGDEESGQDNTILPSDYRRSGPILDDELNERMVSCLPEGVKLISVMDCCHSGTGLDLPFIFNTETNSWRSEKNPKLCQADVMMFSGCRDEETSADVMIPSKGSGGAMSMAVLSTLTANPFNQSLSGLMTELHSIMKQRGFAQRPQLSSTQRMPIDQSVSFVNIIPNLNAQLGRDKQKVVVPPRKKKVHSSANKRQRPQKHPQRHQYKYAAHQKYISRGAAQKAVLGSGAVQSDESGEFFTSGSSSSSSSSSSSKSSKKHTKKSKK